MRRLSSALKNCQPVGRADFEARVQRCFRCFRILFQDFFRRFDRHVEYIYIYIKTFRRCKVVRTSLRDTRPLLVAKVARPRIEHFVPSRCLVFLRSVGKKNDYSTAACIEDAHVLLLLTSDCLATNPRLSFLC